MLQINSSFLDEDSNFHLAERVIRAEYARLCDALSLVPVRLDIYLLPDDQKDAPEAKTSLGLPLQWDPCYSGIQRLICFPLCGNDNWPSQLPPFPPTKWKEVPYDDEWLKWRTDLWHEVIHQVSNDFFNANHPEESGRISRGGTTSLPGHGNDWFMGVCYVTNKFAVEPEDIHDLLCRNCK
jgi:hypothetical protein